MRIFHQNESCLLALSLLHSSREDGGKQGKLSFWWKNFILIGHYGNLFLIRAFFTDFWPLPVYYRILAGLVGQVAEVLVTVHTSLLLGFWVYIHEANDVFWLYWIFGQFKKWHSSMFVCQNLALPAFFQWQADFTVKKEITTVTFYKESPFIEFECLGGNPYV